MVSVWWLLAAFWIGVCVGVVLVGLFSKVERDIPAQTANAAKAAKPRAPEREDRHKVWDIGAAGPARARAGRKTRGNTG